MCAALEDPKLIPGAETPRCFVEQTSRRSCLDDSPLANAALKEGPKEDPGEATGKGLQSKDLLAPIMDPAPFPGPHEPLPTGRAAPFEGPNPDLKFETPLSIHGPESNHTVGGLDAPIIRLDGTSGKPYYQTLLKAAYKHLSRVKQLCTSLSF